MEQTVSVDKDEKSGSRCPKCGYCASTEVTAEWQFHIPRDVVSLNARGTNRGSWDSRSAYVKDRKAWAWHMRAARLAHPSMDLRKVEMPRRRLTLTRLWGPRQRAFDQDNLVGGLKLVVDAMVAEWLLAGDTLEHVQVYYAQRRAGDCEKPGLLVNLEQLR